MNENRMTRILLAAGSTGSPLTAVALTQTVLKAAEPVFQVATLAVGLLTGVACFLMFLAKWQREEARLCEVCTRSGVRPFICLITKRHRPPDCPMNMTATNKPRIKPKPPETTK
jgi:hypothetical protein